MLREVSDTPQGTMTFPTQGGQSQLMRLILSDRIS